MSRSQFRYESQKKEDPALIAAILKIKDKHKKYGLLRVHNRLRKIGFEVNRKKVHRIMKTLNLLVKRARKSRLSNFRPDVNTPVAVRSNHVWAVDFVFSRLKNGTAFRAFTVIDTYTRVCPMIFISQSMADQLPMKILSQLKDRGERPEWIISDNGPEFINSVFRAWTSQNNINHYFIEPGEPTQNGYIESFNGKFRDECLKEETFTSLQDARRKIEAWRHHYNSERPHSSLDYLTPKEFADQQRAMLAI